MAVCYRSIIIAGLFAGTGCVAAYDAPDGTDGTDEEIVETSETTQSLTLDERVSGCRSDPRVIAGTVSVDICTGANLFFREAFNGNGRSCATCHPVDNNFALDRAFIARLPPNDPLFVAEFNPTLARLEIPAQMRGRALILENADGFAPDPTVRFVLRSVPHNLSMGVSVARVPGDPIDPPADRTGWSGDGAPGAGALRDFQTGAITQHYPKTLQRVAGRDFRLATAGELDRIDLFMRQLGRTNELDLATVVMRDARSEAGRATFLAVGCNGCHANAGANAGFGGGGNRNFNTGVEAARNAGLASFPRDGGFLGAPANPDGSFGDGTFNTPPLVEAADTGPFFHTDTTVSGASGFNASTANTIEEAVAFYDSPAFNNSPSGLVGPIDITAAQIEDIGRFLRGVNATFNAAMAGKRLEAAAALVNRFRNNQLAVQREMLRLANVEIIDALEVLSARSGLNADAQTLLREAFFLTEQARLTRSETTRRNAIAAARTRISAVSARIGTNLTYAIGNGTVMF
jgi:mono/diheme cytochrome c family protein